MRGGQLRDVRVSIHGDNSFYSMPKGDQPRFARMTKGRLRKSPASDPGALWACSRVEEAHSARQRVGSEHPPRVAVMLRGSAGVDVN